MKDNRYSISVFEKKQLKYDRIILEYQLKYRDRKGLKWMALTDPQKKSVCKTMG